MTNWVMAEANVRIAAEHEDRLLAAYRRLLSQPLPEGLIQTEIMRCPDGSWRIQTLWLDLASLHAAREGAEPPRLLREIHATAEFAIYEVVAEWISTQPD